MNPILALARSQLESLEARRRKLLEIIALAESLDDPGISQSDDNPPRPSTRRPAQVTLDTYAAVRSLLLERGEPTKISELLEGVVARGIEVGGKDPASTLSARLSNSEEFESIRGVGWWFAQKPRVEVQEDFEEPEEDPSMEPSSGFNPNQEACALFGPPC